MGMHLKQVSNWDEVFFKEFHQIHQNIHNKYKMTSIDFEELQKFFKNSSPFRMID